MSFVRPTLPCRRDIREIKDADLVLDGSGSSDDDEIPESEFPLT